MTAITPKNISKLLAERFPKLNPHQLPKIVSISINSGIGQLGGEKGTMEKIITQIGAITGQRPVVTTAKKSVAAFKIREKQPVGVAVKLRRQKMYDFLSKLINITIPSLRDFQGINPHAFDGHGNLSIGFKEQLYFPEIRHEDVDKSFGLQVNIKTTANNNQDAIALFEVLGLPFKKEENNG